MINGMTVGAFILSSVKIALLSILVAVPLVAVFAWGVVRILTPTRKKNKQS